MMKKPTIPPAGVQACCQDHANRELERADPVAKTRVERCTVCGRRHYTVIADPGVIGVRGAAVGAGLLPKTVHGSRPRQTPPLGLVGPVDHEALEGALLELERANRIGHVARLLVCPFCHALRAAHAATPAELELELQTWAGQHRPCELAGQPVSLEDVRH